MKTFNFYESKPSPENRFFLSIPMDDGSSVLRFYPTAESRDRAANNEIAGFTDDGAWRETVRRMVSGEVTAAVARVGCREPDPFEREHRPNVPYFCMFELRPLGTMDDPPPALKIGVSDK